MCLCLAFITTHSNTTFIIALFQSLYHQTFKDKIIYLHYLSSKYDTTTSSKHFKKIQNSFKDHIMIIKIILTSPSHIVNNLHHFYLATLSGSQMFRKLKHTPHTNGQMLVKLCLLYTSHQIQRMSLVKLIGPRQDQAKVLV